MRAAKTISLALLALLAIALLGSPSLASASTFDQGDGWYQWSVDAPEDAGYMCCRGQSSDELTIFVRTRNGNPVSIRAIGVNCGKAPKEPATDLGHLTLEQSDALLLEIVTARDVDMDVREDAMFWLVHTGSDATFEYVDSLLSSR